MLKQRNIIALLFALVMAACATVVPPAGGEKDTTPPVPEEYKPANYSRNFNKSKVSIKFDEFVVLKKLSQQLVISPEMPETPEVTIQGKKVIIKLPDSLSENTTYTIFFGNAIVNYKENIAVNNFEYVLSTGDEVDSLMIEGTLVNALDHKPPEGAFVMLYQHYDDSIPYNERPYYLTKIEPNGHFHLNNIHEGAYKIFALLDLNSNYLFDLPTEEIAFLDSLVAPYVDPYWVEMAPRDSADSTIVQSPKPLNLFLFSEPITDQIILSSKLYSANRIQIAFSKPLQDLELKALNLKKDTTWHFDWISPNKDTLTAYLMGVRQDTLQVEVSDEGQVLDTLRFILRKAKRAVTTSRRDKKKLEKQKPKPKKTPKLKLTTNARGGFPFFSDIHIKFKTPLTHWDLTQVKILFQRDTIVDTLDCQPYFMDSVYNMHLVIPFKFKEYQKYGLFVPDSVFYDLYGTSHDTINQMFVTTELRDYGSLGLTIDYFDDIPLIVQLLNPKNKVLQSHVLQESGKIVYPYLKPGEYRIKAIRDENKNGKWDTGEYMIKLQPEMTYFVDKMITIRANWDVEHTWIIK